MKASEAMRPRVEHEDSVTRPGNGVKYFVMQRMSRFLQTLAVKIPILAAKSVARMGHPALSRQLHKSFAAKYCGPG